MSYGDSRDTIQNNASLLAEHLVSEFSSLLWQGGSETTIRSTSLLPIYIC